MSIVNKQEIIPYYFGSKWLNMNILKILWKLKWMAWTHNKCNRKKNHFYYIFLETVICCGFISITKLNRELHKCSRCSIIPKSNAAAIWRGLDKDGTVWTKKPTVSHLTWILLVFNKSSVLEKNLEWVNRRRIFITCLKEWNIGRGSWKNIKPGFEFWNSDILPLHWVI